MLLAQILAAIAVITGATALVLLLRPWWERINRWVFAQIDKHRLFPLKLKLEEGEEPLFVSPKHPVAVWEKLLIRGLVSIFLGGIAGFFLVVGISIYQFFSDPATSNFGFGQWIAEAIVVGLVVCVPVLLFTWFTEEWNRRHFRYVLCTGKAWAVGIDVITGLPYISYGPTRFLDEIFVGWEPKAIVKKRRPLWLRLYMGRLWKWQGIEDIYLPSRVFGAADTWRRVPWAWGVKRILLDVRREADDWALAKGRALIRYHDTRLDEALEEGGWVSGTDALDILAAYNRMVGDGPFIDLMTVKADVYNAEELHKGLDEGKEVAAARPTAPIDLTAFPTFEES